jgi:type II secretory pathway pseudopilin PulG
VRAVGRVRLPLGAKAARGFAVVAALLAIVAALGLVALSQSNSRGERLRSLQLTAGYAQLLAQTRTRSTGSSFGEADRATA